MKKKIIFIVAVICMFLFVGKCYAYKYYAERGSGIKLEKTKGGFKPREDYKKKHKNSWEYYNGDLIYGDNYARKIYSDGKKFPPELVRENCYYLLNGRGNNNSYKFWAAIACYYESLIEIEYRISSGEKKYNDIEDIQMYISLCKPWNEEIIGVANSGTPAELAESLNVALPNNLELDDPLYNVAFSPGISSTFSGMRISLRGLLTLEAENHGDPSGYGGKKFMHVTSKDYNPSSEEFYWCRVAILLNEKADELYQKLTGTQSEKISSGEMASTSLDANFETMGGDNRDYRNEYKLTVDVGGDSPKLEAKNVDWWTAAQNFFKGAKNSGSNSKPANDLMTNLENMIFRIGNMIFIIVTSFMGIRYIFAAAEGKAQIKDSLLNIVVAAMFFYGYEAIKTILGIGDLFLSGTFETTTAKVYNTVLFIINLLAISGVVWLGVKYMLSSAEGKANIKTNWVPIIFGIVMVYATVWFLTTIVDFTLG